VGILAAIAYPSYTSQMQQTRRADCEGVLMQLAGAMERDFSRNNQYRNIITAGAFPANQCPLDGGTATYNLSINPVTATTFQLNATPVNAQVADACGTLTLTNQMTKGQSSGTTAQCWQ
jgi:type IV pilus assembly protein PilE